EVHPGAAKLAPQRAEVAAPQIAADAARNRPHVTAAGGAVEQPLRVVGAAADVVAFEQPLHGLAARSAVMMKDGGPRVVRAAVSQRRYPREEIHVLAAAERGAGAELLVEPAGLPHDLRPERHVGSVHETGR